MKGEKKIKGDKGLMIVSGAIILLGLGSLFVNSTLGIILTLVGIGLFIMGFVSKIPIKKANNE